MESRVEKSPHLGGEHGEGNQGAEETQGHPVGGELADAKVAADEAQLAGKRQARVPDVMGRPPPQLHGATRPPMLLLAVRKEAGWQLYTVKIC
jgi:hypothetical protein